MPTSIWEIFGLMFWLIRDPLALIAGFAGAGALIAIPIEIANGRQLVMSIALRGFMAWVGAAIGTIAPYLMGEPTMTQGLFWDQNTVLLSLGGALLLLVLAVILRRRARMGMM